MLVENKIQIEAIKTRNYLAEENDNTVMITDGYMIVYIPKDDCLIDISKLRQVGEKFLRNYDREKLKKKLVKARLSKRALFLDKRTVRLYESDLGVKIWLDTKYIKLFDGCDTYSVDTGGDYKMIAFVRYEEIIGLVLPVRVGNDSWNE